jgi:release factor glutamine methyltransferase
MPEAQRWTIGRLLEWTARHLGDRGSTTPRLDAEVLLAQARGCQRIDLYTAFDEEPGEAIRAAYRELVRRRAEGTPVAHLVGRREFYSLSFRVTPDVLIPRPETELVVVALLDRIKARPAGPGPIAIADVGTGSGILAICAARHASNCHVTAIDLSPAALAVAAENAATHGVSDRVKLMESDLFAALPPEERFDYVVSNPPYVSTAELARLAQDVRRYEPRIALEGGERGTEVIERLVVQAADRLRPDGWLLMEISPRIEPAVRQLLAAGGSWELHPTIKDLAGHPRVVQARRKP